MGSEEERRAGWTRTDLFDSDYLFGLVVYCLVDRAEAACAEFIEQGVLTCGTAAGNRAGISGTIQVRPWRRLGWSRVVEISLTWFPESVTGGRHGGLSESWVDVWSVDTCK